eukprot:gene26131-32664_t
MYGDVEQCVLSSNAASIGSPSKARSLCEEMSTLLFEDAISDVTIHAGDETIAAHKFILCLRSEVFRAMLTGQMSESASLEVQIPDFEAAVVREFLHFLYTDSVSPAPRVMEQHAEALLAMSCKYQVRGLETYCENYLCASLSLANVVEVLSLADLYQAAHLKARSLMFISHNAKAVVQSEAFRALSLDLYPEVMRAVVGIGSGIGSGGGGLVGGETAGSEPPIVHSYFCSDLLGRRIVSGYSISSGYIVRTQSLRFTIENDTSALSAKENKKASANSNNLVKSNTISGGSSSSASSSSRKPFPIGSGSRDKFSAGKLFFDTYHDPSAGALTAQQKNVRGRLSNGLCDFLVPLLRARLVELRGHIAYDYGQVGTFQDIPVSLHIYAAPQLMDMTGSGGGAASGHVDHEGESGKRLGGSGKALPRELHEAANDLLIWLAEGETAVALLKQQRDKERAAKLSANALVPTNNKSDSAIHGALASRGSSASLTDEDSADRTARTFDEGVTACIEGEGGGPEAEEPTMCVDEFLSHEALLNNMPLAAQPLALSTALTMKAYQLQALHWMRQREVLVELGSGVTRSDNMLLRQTNSSSSASAESEDCEVVFCEPPPSKSALSLPHEGLLRFPVQWGAAQREANPLWMPIASYRNDRNRWGVSPQLVQASVAEHEVTDSASLPQSDDEGVNVFWWNRYSQRIQREAPHAPRPCRGGILAHEMGMGKTVMAIALIAADTSIEERVMKDRERKRESKVVRIGDEEDDDVMKTGKEMCVDAETSSNKASQPPIATKMETGAACSQGDVPTASKAKEPPFRRSTRRRIVQDEDLEDEKVPRKEEAPSFDEGPVVRTSSDEEEEEAGGGETLKDTSSDSDSTSSDDEYSLSGDGRGSRKERGNSSAQKRKRGGSMRQKAPVSRRAASPEVVDLMDSDCEEEDGEVRAAAKKETLRGKGVGAASGSGSGSGSGR